MGHSSGRVKGGKPLLQGPPRARSTVGQGRMCAVLREGGNASCAHRGSSCSLLGLCHVQKSVQARGGLGEWRPEEDSGGRRVLRKEETAGPCGVLTVALKLYVLWMVWSLQCEISRENKVLASSLKPFGHYNSLSTTASFSTNCLFFYCLQRGVVLDRTTCPPVIVSQTGQSESGPIDGNLRFHLKTVFDLCK